VTVVDQTDGLPQSLGASTVAGRPEVPPARSERADEMRGRRAMGRRMAAYDGVRYDDRMASSPRVRVALESHDGS
jgi:hypothetical protein